MREVFAPSFHPSVRAIGSNKNGEAIITWTKITSKNTLIKVYVPLWYYIIPKKAGNNRKAPAFIDKETLKKIAER